MITRETLAGFDLFKGIPADVLEAHPEAGFKIMLRITGIVADRLRNSRGVLLKTM